MGFSILIGFFGLSLLLLCVLERIFHAFLIFAMGSNDKDNLRAGLLLGSFLNFATTLWTTAINIVFRSIGFMGWVFVWYIVFYIISSMWFVLYEDYPQVVIQIVDFYSKRVGPFLHGYLLLPLELLNLVLKAVLPVYNGFVWVLRGLFTKGLLPILWDELDLLADLCVALLGLVKSLSVSVVDFLFSLSCDDLSCLSKTAVFDALSVMGSVRDTAVISSKLGSTLCSPISSPIDFSLYLLVDTRFAKAVHSLLNAFLHLVFHTPRNTLKRCSAFGQNSTHTSVLLCTPDLAPIFDHAVSGLRDLGGAVDNLLGVGSAMARRTLKGLPDDCTVKTVGPDKFRGELLSGLQTTVGLTDWLMAAANGTFAYFWGQVSTDTAVRSWPEPVDISLGVAAVGFDEAGEVEVSGVTQGQRPGTRQTTSLMGCRCVDSDKGIVVRCSILPLMGSGTSETHSFDVLFQDTTWSSGMTCSAAEVTVRSVRWPVRRYEGKSVPFSAGYMDVPATDCMSRGSCESVDATVWLVPRCDLLRPEQCSDVAVGTSCFPFCMAARISGSRNSNPVFVNAETWRSGKQLLMRDCTLGSVDAIGGISLAYGTTVMSTAAVGTPFSSGSQVFVSGAGDGSKCVSGSNLVSWVPLNSSSRDQRSVPAYLRRKGQPFAISGDAILMEFLQADGASTVEVDRLTGNQRDSYSLVSGWAGLPTAPKFYVPIEELTSEERSRVVVPIDFRATRTYSTSSRNYVFYSVSPDLRIFQAYLDYCRDSSSLPRAQLMMASSYSALRVYRVRAYCQESCEKGSLTAQFTFDGFSNGAFNASTFPQNCSRRYNASIEALEYVNEQNIAVTVQVADRTYDPVQRQGTGSRYVTYWLNPQTMRARRDTMWPMELPVSLGAGLCVPGDGVPHVGSLGAELLVSGIHAFHKLVGMFIYAPGMLSFWRGGSSCPLESSGHSVLASCGSSVFDLDDFFDSLDSASSIFWGIPNWAAEQIEQGKTVDYSPVSDLLRGYGAFGRGSVGITEIRGGIVNLLNIPIADQITNTYALIRQPGALSGVSKVAGGSVSWARFTSRFLSIVAVNFVKKLLVEGSVNLSDVWRYFVNALYDHKGFFKSSVTDRGISACMGLEIMFGGSTPPGRLLYHGCLSSVTFIDGAMNLFLHMFVNAPVVKCVCKDSEGKRVSLYAREHCVFKAPQTMQPLLYGMISSAEGLIRGDSLLCPAVVTYTRTSLENSFKPYFSTVFSSLDALGDSIDYLLSGFDVDSGQCTNFRSDPHVVVIMPEPVDYFRGCGATSYCKTKCSGTWDAFDSARSEYDPTRLSSSRELDTTVDSLFFPSMVPDMVAPGKVVALTQPDSCGDWICRTNSEDCLAVAWLAGGTLTVSFYCIPSGPTSVVYASEFAALPWSSSSVKDASKVSFLRNDGSALAALVGQQIILIQRGAPDKVVLDVTMIFSLPLLGMYPMNLIDFLAVRGNLLVSVSVRTGNSAKFERGVSTVWVDPFKILNIFADMSDVPSQSELQSNPALEAKWKAYFYDVNPVVVDSPVMKDLWRGYASSEYVSADENSVTMILWPVSSTGTLRKVVLSWTNKTVSAKVLPIQQSQTLIAKATLMPRQLVLSKTLRIDPVSGQVTIYASAGNVYDWLRQLRLAGSDVAMTSASLSNAQLVKATIGVNSSCDGLDCRGCPDLTLRSLCSAYQSCSVFRCIGTPVNLKRPLCGVGQVLKSLGNLGVTNVQGAWIMFVDIFMILLQLKVVTNLPGVDVSFPDDSFLGNMCAAKDVSAEFFSILTSTVNSVLQRVQGSVDLLSRFSVVDTSINTIISMSMAAVTGFLHQLALAPVYMLSVGHKIMMCQVSGFLAVSSVTGTRIDIQPARFAATDAIGGMCLTKGAELNAEQTGDSQAVKGITSHAAEILAGTGQSAVMRRLEPYMHMVDGFLAYLIGVVAKLADVLQTTDIKHCVLPDVTLQDTVRCACGDQPLTIQHLRSQEGLSQYAYWCTGTISLVGAENSIRTVWNPYTYAELQQLIGKNLDNYVQNAGRNVLAEPPNDPVFVKQGVSLLAVFTKCRQNYVNKQWDHAAFVRYDKAVSEREIRGAIDIVHGDPADGVGRCLLDSVAKGAGNGACLDSFLMTHNQNSMYWSYDIANATVGSNMVDACLVFSGPASARHVSEARQMPFQNCLGGYTNQSACDLSGFVWSPSSSNDVPVASRHPIRAGQDGTHLRDAIQKRMNSASQMVMAKLKELQDYSNSKLQAMVFSAEGDIIHQLMDCVFLGPYARMDYWPVPRCDESIREDCLVGPYWSRDDNRGKTRNIDVKNCNAAKEIPFTCGSPTRKAMVRDFVEQYLETGQGGAEMVTKMVQGWIQDMTQMWSDPLAFSCNCTDCCKGYLPKKLADVSLQIPTNNIINALGKRLKLFYMYSMHSAEPWFNELDHDEFTKYDWTNSGGSNQVAKLGLYDPTSPTIEYDETNAMSPPSVIGGVNLWRICHSALKQILFTMPVSVDGTLKDVNIGFSGGGPEIIEQHVKQMVASAKEKSPLFRHYQARHHPSFSRMCNGSATSSPKIVKGSVRFDDYVVNGVKLFDASEIPLIPVVGYDAGVLGAQWSGTSGGLNEHLGFLDRDATEKWLQGATTLVTSSEYLMRYGPGGLKLGNLPGSTVDLGLQDEGFADLHEVLKEGYSEADRAFAPNTATLHGCDSYLVNSTNLLLNFVDKLFPMAQGIRESGVGSYCLRFAIELAILYSMEWSADVSSNDWVAQKELVVTWRRKCGTQVQLVGMCNALDLYHPSSFQTVACNMQWTVVINSSVEMYVTPECLIKIGDVFYDPCQCKPEWCEKSTVPWVIKRSDIENDNCKVKLDPRNVVQAVELGWWGEDISDGTASSWNDWLSDPVNLLDMQKFKEGILGDGQAVGNTPLDGHWVDSEGFLNVTGSFCDMVADYWPEDMMYPVGYHVTTPCHQDDSGYRTFDNVFALDSDLLGQPTMVYLEDQTRDFDLVDSHFGSGGLCRGQNFALDMYQTNTMRVCTKVTDGEDVDVHVPRGNIKQTQLGIARCSESSKELPWGDYTFYDYYDASFYSVGTVPNLPQKSARMYPETRDRFMEIGPQQHMQREGWGLSCQDFFLPNCTEGKWECPDGFVCKSGVCMHSSVQCTRHSECPADKMCSGMGTCETPRLSIVNELGEDVSVRAHTTACAGESFSMRGGSYWGYVPDILEAHGMCSYRHWQEYLYTLGKCSCASSTSNTCQLSAGECPFYRFSKQQIANRWWNDTENAPTRLKMIPTTCDRDYERFSLNDVEMKSCVPGLANKWLVKSDGTYQQDVTRDKMWQIYDEASKQAPLRLMPSRSSKSTGFLGVSEINSIKSCMSVQQCYVDKFYKNNILSMTTTKTGLVIADRTLADSRLYDPNDQFRCGVIGYYNPDTKKCSVDYKLFPIYYAMCKQPSKAVLGMCRPMLKSNSVPARCDDVRDPYDPDYSVIHDVNVPALNNFFYIFNQPQTLEEHLSLVTCMEGIYTLMSLPKSQGGIFDSKGLYIPFTFTLYEIPFSWFYQCMIGSSTVVSLDLEKKLFTCTFYDNKRELTSPILEEDYYRDFKSFIYNVRGGFKKTLLDSALNTQRLVAIKAWEAAVESVRSSLFKSPNVDNTYPVCFPRLDWNIPNSDILKLKMIEIFATEQSCSQNQLSNYIKRFNEANPGTSYNTETILQVLTVATGTPVPQANILQSQKLLTGLIKSWGIEVINTKVAYRNINITRMPIRMDFKMPPVNSDEFSLKKSQWVKLANVLPNSQDIKQSTPSATGTLKDVYRNSAGVLMEQFDSNKQLGMSTPVQAFSVYATGLFKCSYPSLTINRRTKKLTGDTADGDLEVQFGNYSDFLYAEVLRVYNLNLNSVNVSAQLKDISMNQLNFYDDEANLNFGSSWHLDLRNVASYLSNIQPDTKTPVMCVAGNQQVNFNECSNPNFDALKEHVSTMYSKNSGVVIPNLYQLDWDVHKGMMTSGAIYSYSSTQRNISKQFLSRLFDSDTVCGASSTSSSKDKLCYFDLTGSIGATRVISPWLAGDWNPFDQCDVTQLDLQSGNAEVVDSICYLEEYCPTMRGRDPTLDYYKYMPNMQCKDKDNERTTHINVNSRFLYNLCKHRLNEDSICNHTQGMLGGFDGKPSESYETGGNLFNLHEFTAFPAGEQQMFKNSLLTGSAGEYGFWRSSLNHIGGHHLGMEVNSQGSMRVTKLPLKPVTQKARMERWDTKDVRDWTAQWSVGIADDDLLYQATAKDVQFYLDRDQRGQVKLGWDCPLRRRAFYGGDVPNFRPLLPSARRSRLLFGNLTGNSYAHPMQRRLDASDVFANYKTTNGFCFCPVAEESWNDMCSVLTSVKDEHNCSLYNTIQALQGRKWAWSHTFRPRNKNNEFKTCEVQLDWPFVKGTLRDGATVTGKDVDPAMWSQASDVEGSACHVLDRMPDFAYAYASKRELLRSGFHTLQRGVCHTGRVQRRLDDTRRCVRFGRNVTAAILKCSENAGSTVERPRSKLPRESVFLASSHRRLCRKCTQPPEFYTRGGKPLTPESSFGIPYRLSAERVISNDLKKVLCANTSDCLSTLNASAWKTGTFLPTLLKDPKLLFARPGISKASGLAKNYEPSLKNMPDDTALWARKWVHCPTQDALKTGVGCNGSISKAQWRADKVGMCYATMLESLQGGEDPFAATDICNIDSRLSQLCVSIREAQSVIAAANCLQSGNDKCALQEFVYSPSTWETTNQAFVHQTVKEFYMRTDGCTSDASDCICPSDSTYNSLHKNNSYILKECNAVPVMAFRDVLIQVRGMVFTICKILSLLIDIIFNLVLSIKSSSRDHAMNSVILDWAQLKQESSSFLDKVSDMFFDMIFSVGNLGPWLKHNYMNACGVINSAYLYFADIWCNIVVQQLPSFLGALRALGGWFEVGWSIVNDVFSVILNDMLPNALIDLYQMGYREYFQSARYREKQAAYEDRKQAGLLNLKDKRASSKGDYIPPDNKFLQELGDAKEKKIQNSNKRMGAKAAQDALAAFSSLPILGKLGGAVDMALTGYELYQTITTAIKVKEALEKFPTSFTVFNFDDFYLSMDAFVEFLNADFTCYTMSADVPPLQCTLLNFSEPSLAEVKDYAPRASACWAEAQQRQVGVSNLYSCTATSTCCTDPLNCDDTSDGVRLCSECPSPPPEGLRTYGCNTMLQRCQCGVEIYSIDRCSAQRDCGPKASCSLLTSLDDVSFGSLRSCTECSTSPICLMGSSQQFGKCTCLTSAEAKVDLCEGPVGSPVNPTVTKLCGLTSDRGGYYEWNELSLVMCANAVSPRCAEVITETGQRVYMSVANSMRAAQTAYSSRRLLSVPDTDHKELLRIPSAFLPENPVDDLTPEMVHRSATELPWNHTAAPCSSVVHAYKTGNHLGPVDELALHSCVYWRTVARQLIKEHSLKALADLDTFLLSSSDMAASLGQRGVLREIMLQPWILLHAMLYSQWAKPVRAALVASHDAKVVSLLRKWGKRLLRKAKRRDEIDLQKLEREAIQEISEFSNHGPNRGRKLLGIFEDTRERIRALPYYSLVRSSVKNITFDISPETSAGQKWLSDSFVWKGEKRSGECEVINSFSSLVNQAIRVCVQYYSHILELSSPKVVRRGFKNVLPSVGRSNLTFPSLSRPLVFAWSLNALGISMNDVVSFLSDPCPKDDCASANRWTAMSLTESLMFCKLESVMFCSNYRNDMIMSALFVFLIYIAVSMVCGYFGLYGVSTLFFISIPVLVVWYSSGVSPRCFPMIPTCLLDELLVSIKSLFPAKAVLPPLLTLPNKTLKSCSQLGFLTWEDPLAFAACDLGFCGNLSNTKLLGVSSWNFETMLQRASSPDANAYRICASVTSTYALPVIFIFNFFLATFIAFALGMTSLSGPFVNLLWQSVMLNHGNH